MHVRPVWNATLIDVGTGRRFLRDLGRGGSGAREILKQALKAGLAAVAAWVLAVHVLRLPLPYVAPWAAMIMVRTTVYWSVVSAARQVAAVTLGIVLAYLAGIALPTTELTLAVLVPVTILASRWHRLDDQGMYVPFTALFMVTIGGIEGAYILSRLAETALGVSVGAAVNLLVFPPVRVKTTGDAERRAGEEVGQALRDMAEGLRGEWDAEDTRGWVDRAELLEERIWEVRRLLRHGRESLRLNPRRPRRRYTQDVDRYHAASNLMSRTTAALQTIANSLHQDGHGDTPYGALDAAFSARYASVLDTAADALDERLAGMLAGAVSEGSEVRDTDPSTAVPPGVMEALEHALDPQLSETAVAVELKGALLASARRLFRGLSA